MKVIIANLKIAPDQSTAFEDMMSRLAADIRAGEPGTRLYQLCRPREPEGSYTLIEMYEDQAAIDAHIATPWFKAALPRFEAFLTEPPRLKFLRTVGE